jgi:DNA-binding CsgD family transcriptional regulator
VTRIAYSRRVLTAATKKGRSDVLGAISRERVRNSQQSQVPNANGGKKAENPLGLARSLCVLANAGLTVRESSGGEHQGEAGALNRQFGDGGSFLMSTEVQGHAGAVREKRIAEAIDLLWQAKWRPDDSRLKNEFAGTLARVSEGFAGERPVPVWLAVLRHEIRRMAYQLDELISCQYSGAAFYIESRRLFTAKIDGQTGRVRLDPVDLLGGYQDVFKGMLDHSGPDVRRFARCAHEKCRSFFYRPRLSSRACSKRCENALRAREHYWLEIGRREVANTLQSGRKSVLEIASWLGISPKRVRQYLSNTKEKANGTQTQHR